MKEEKKEKKLDPLSAKSHRILRKYKLLLQHLIGNGALLAHVNAINLLDLDLHLIAQEHHTKLIEGARLTPKMLAMKKEVWTSTWETRCKRAWMDILFQIIRVYIMSRISYRDLIKLPGVSGMGAHHAADGGADDPKAAKGTKKKPKKEA